jgi:hypothetical protein
MNASTNEVAFYPGEVVRLLGLAGTDYSQIRRLFRLARTLRGEECPSTTWARFTLADLAAVEVLVSLGGGRDALLERRRLILGRVDSACTALIAMGFDNPLLQVPLARDGRRIIARIDGCVFEPVSGQLVIEETSIRIDAFLEQRIIADRAVRSAIRVEKRRITPKRELRVATRALILLSNSSVA